MNKESNKNLKQLNSENSKELKDLIKALSKFESNYILESINTKNHLNRLNKKFNQTEKCKEERFNKEQSTLIRVFLALLVVGVCANAILFNWLLS